MKLTLFLLAFGGLLLSALAVACGDDDGSGGESASTTGGNTPAPVASATPAPLTEAFPVTIEHKYGSTTIEEAPERVVSVGFLEQDTILALGMKPVAVREWWNEQPSATWVWAREALGDAEPLVLPSGELDFEQIAALQPDLIIGFYSGITQEEYNLLSQIAPTVTQPGEYVDYGMPWQEMTLGIGKVLGKEAEVRALIDGAEAKFDGASEDHPEFLGRKVAFAGDSGDGTYWTYGPEDPRSRLLANLGFEYPEAIKAVGDDAFYATLSSEQGSLLDVDVLIWLLEDGVDPSSVLADPVLSQLEVVKDGRVIFMGWNSNLTGALSFTSVLSLPYALDELLPQLSEAVGKLP